MNLIFTPTAWEQYTEWQQTDKSMVKQINKLIKDIERNGLLKGLGKPEPLKYRKMCSRRIENILMTIIKNLHMQFMFLENIWTNT